MNSIFVSSVQKEMSAERRALKQFVEHDLSRAIIAYAKCSISPNTSRNTVPVL